MALPRARPTDSHKMQRAVTERGVACATAAAATRGGGAMPAGTMTSLRPALRWLVMPVAAISLQPGWAEWSPRRPRGGRTLPG